MRRAIRTSLACSVLCAAAAGQVEVQRVVPPDTEYGDYYGRDIDIDGTTIALPEVATKQVMLFEEEQGEWVVRQRLDIVLDQAGAHFDSWLLGKVDLCGDWLAVGVQRYASLSGGSYVGSGEVQLFHRSEGVWSLAQVVIPEGGSDFDAFGEDLALAGDTLVVGAPHYGIATGGDPCPGCPGSVYVFERASTQPWKQVARVLPPPGVKPWSFGMAVATDGTRALASASGPSTSTFFLAVEVLERAHGQWQVVDELSWGPQLESNVGLDLALEGDTALVGNPYFDAVTTAGTGAVLVWERVADGWNWTATLVPGIAAPGMSFGREVALYGDEAIVAAPSGPVGPQAGASGRVYHFHRQDGVWQKSGELTVAGSSTQQLGTAVSVHGAHAAITSWGDSDYCEWIYSCTGAGYVFELAPEAQQYCACNAGPCGGGPQSLGCSNSTGLPGYLSAGGAASVASDELRLEAHWLPANEVAVVFMGGAATNLPFANGQLCVAPGTQGLFRLDTTSTGDGELAIGPGLVAWTQANLPPAGQIAAGDTWYFQCWYRDLESTCGAASNLTNGVRVDFVH